MFLIFSPFEEAIKGNFVSSSVGDSFGPSWATFWFKVSIQNPFKGLIHFIWDSESEGLIYSTTGSPIQSLTGGNGWDKRHIFELSQNAKGGENFEFFIEMACNGMFGVGQNDLINPPDMSRRFYLRTAEVRVPNLEVWSLLYDFQIISGMARELPADSQRGCDALKAANEIINQWKYDDKNSWKNAATVSQKFFSKKGNESHKVFAIGHCHIDTAWLWPYAETKRKAARSWATQVHLMKKYPKFKFACSQAQQFEWVAALYPKLFEEIKTMVKAGQFIPIGGTWVEMDCNVGLFIFFTQGTLRRIFCQTISFWTIIF
jgi:alpha-mannosidase